MKDTEVAVICTLALKPFADLATLHEANNTYSENNDIVCYYNTDIEITLLQCKKARHAFKILQGQ